MSTTQTQAAAIAETTAKEDLLLPDQTRTPASRGAMPMAAVPGSDQTRTPASRGAMPMAAVPGSDQTSRTDQGVRGSHTSYVGAGPQTTHSSHRERDDQSCPAAVGQTTDTGHSPRETSTGSAGAGNGGNGSSGAIGGPKPSSSSPLWDPFLAVLADMLDDLEQTRIANENRVRQFTRAEVDVDGEERGFGLTDAHPGVATAAGIVDALKAAEHQATLNLQRALRKNPLHPWVKAQRGIGEKQAARLLAVIGDPYWHDADNRPRLVSELWSFCGHGDPARRRRKGMSQVELLAMGSPVAKMRLHLIAEACLKAGGDYADVYRKRRANTDGRTHATACVRCGPSGHPAAEGSPWSAGHQHADALRIVGKEILRDLWTEARRLHTT